jgi:hypothetical protein
VVSVRPDTVGVRADDEAVGTSAERVFGVAADAAVKDDSDAGRMAEVEIRAISASKNDRARRDVLVLGPYSRCRLALRG